MAWPTTAVATGDLITAAQLNGLPVRLADSTLTGTAAAFDLTSIPSVYKHLLLAIYGRSENAVLTGSHHIRFNGDTGNNYDTQRVEGQAATSVGGEVFGGAFMTVGFMAGASASANLFGGSLVFIPHYANAANNKMLVSLNGSKSGTSTSNLYAHIYAGFWRSNSAINQITVTSAGGDFSIGSRVTLYGLA